MILTDDHFASIVKAIAEGRAVYSNIRKFLLYILNSNMSEAVPSAGQFYTGRAVLDVRTYRASTAELLGSETYQVGANNTPGELGPSPLAAETEAAKEVGRRAAAGIAVEFADALPRRR